MMLRAACLRPLNEKERGALKIIKNVNRHANVHVQTNHHAHHQMPLGYKLHFICRLDVFFHQKSAEMNVTKKIIQHFIVLTVARNSYWGAG